MGSKHSRRRTFSEDFILTLLREYYSSEVSINFICRKYDIGSASFYQWQKKYDLDEKKLSLSHDIITKVKALRKRLFCAANPTLLPCKMISKIQLIGNKEVTLFVKLNR